MQPRDVEIWERFMEQFPDAYDSCEYGVRVGSVPEHVANHDDPAMRAQAEIYMREIDVVAYKGDEVDIIELKPRAGTSALGQVTAYRLLWMRDRSDALVPKCVVITDELLQDMNLLAAAQGVTMVVV